MLAATGCRVSLKKATVSKEIRRFSSVYRNPGRRPSPKWGVVSVTHHAARVVFGSGFGARASFIDQQDLSRADEVGLGSYEARPGRFSQRFLTNLTKPVLLL